MNAFAAKAIWNGVAWNGAFRAAEHGDFHTVQINGEPAPFATREEAESAAHKALVGYLNGNYRRDGDTLTSAIAAADAHFPGLIRQKGKTRLTVVERRRA